MWHDCLVLVEILNTTGAPWLGECLETGFFPSSIDLYQPIFLSDIYIPGVGLTVIRVLTNLGRVCDVALLEIPRRCRITALTPPCAEMLVLELLVVCILPSLTWR